MDNCGKTDLINTNQIDLRRLMLEQKIKIVSFKPVAERIKSPLAKYGTSGALSCVLCRTTIKSSNVWKVHINSKLHKENMLVTKNMKDKLIVSSRKHKPVQIDLLQNEGIAIQQRVLNKVNIKKQNASEPVEITLPEKFFDDPIKDAKARNAEYKNHQDNEWEKFQREIKEMSTISNIIIAEERDEASIARQLEEIDDQMTRWSKFIQLEHKKESVLEKSIHHNKKDIYLKENEFSDNSNDFDEFPDWRLKKLHC